MVADRDAIYGIQTAFLPILLSDWYDIGGNMTLSRGGWGSGTSKLACNVACNNTTVTSTLHRRVLLPNGLATLTSISSARNETQDMADPVLRIKSRITGAPATSAQLDAEARISDGNGGVGSDVNVTSAINLLSAGTNVWATHDFTLDMSVDELAEADELDILIRSVLNDGGGSGGGVIEIGQTYLLIPKRGV